MSYSDFHSTLKTNYRDWQRFLDWWCGEQTFTRDVLFGGVRKLTNGTNHLLKQMLFFCDPVQNANRNRSNPDVWLSVFSYREIDTEWSRPRPDYETAIVDRMLFDFDADVRTMCPTIEDLRAPYDEAMSLQEEEGATVLFSGRKGFQAHVKCNLHPAQLKGIQEQWQNVEGWQTSDPSVYGDLTRVCRLPYTVHATSGLQCVLIKKGEPLEEIYERAQSVNIPRRI